MTADVFNLGDVRRKARKPRPAKYVWLDTVKADPRLGNYPHLSPRFLADYAELLSSFSSFQCEGVYAGRPNLGRRLGVSIRQITRANLAMTDMGYVKVERRGRSSNLVIPFLNAARLFSMGPEVTSKVTLDGTSGSHRTAGSMGPSGHPSLLELSSSSLKPSSPSSPPSGSQCDGTPAADGKTRSGLPSEAGQESNSDRDALRAKFDALHGPGYADQLVDELHERYPQFSRDQIWRETLPSFLEPVPGPITTFQRFWSCCTEPRGKIGPARAYWLKLTDLDLTKISDLTLRGYIDTGGSWVVTWLKARGWEDLPRAQREATQHVVMLEPYGTEWKLERARLIAAGESVAFMDSQAAAGKGWSVYRGRE